MKNVSNWLELAENIWKTIDEFPDICEFSEIKLM